MLIVIALSNSNLLQPWQTLTIKNLRANCMMLAKKIAKIAKSHQVVLIHGNAPQLESLSLQTNLHHFSASHSFDVLGAQNQGIAGYLLQQALGNTLPNRSIATVLTQVLVEKNDQAFLMPSRPIGPVYQKKQLARLQKKHPHWHLQETQQGWRRLVALPSPKEIIELTAIQQLLQQNTLVIAAGNGIPCVKNNNELESAEAVIDKDLTASLLACSLKADHLIILTNKDAVYAERGKASSAKRIGKIAASELSNLTISENSMQHKIKAACQFALHNKRAAIIGNLFDLEKMIVHGAGTHVLPA